MKRYVVGFMLDGNMRNIAMIEKNHPEWQVGKFNGIGGKIEYPEQPIEAMIREFYEEAGVSTGPDTWAHVCTLRFPYAEVEFFAGKSDEYFSAAKTMESESIVKLPLTQEFFMGAYPVIENIPALVELSIQRLKDREGWPHRRKPRRKRFRTNSTAAELAESAAAGSYTFPH